MHQPNVLTDAEVAAFAEDGYLVKRGFFGVDEIDALRQASLDDLAIRRRIRRVDDGRGGATEIALWNEPGDDGFGALARGERLVRGAERLLGGEVYHYHSKLNEKQAGGGGTWVWHQDYGYWYENGCLLPDMLAVAVPLAAVDERNGCLRLLRGSHRMGRLQHLQMGAQSGADPQRVDWARQRFEEVSFEGEPGDVLFFHSNTLHTSSPNVSDRVRSLLLVAYNAASNDPVIEHHHPRYHPIEVLPDTELLVRASSRDGETRRFLDETTDHSADAFEQVP